MFKCNGKCANDIGDAAKYAKRMGEFTIFLQYPGPLKIICRGHEVDISSARTQHFSGGVF